jgi:hypothetical protein
MQKCKNSFEIFWGYPIAVISVLFIFSCSIAYSFLASLFASSAAD